MFPKMVRFELKCFPALPYLIADIVTGSPKVITVGGGDAESLCLYLQGEMLAVVKEDLEGRKLPIGG